MKLISSFIVVIEPIAIFFLRYLTYLNHLTQLWHIKQKGSVWGIISCFCQNDSITESYTVQDLFDKCPKFTDLSTNF